jgi:hypothetical protein
MPSASLDTIATIVTNIGNTIATTLLLAVATQLRISATMVVAGLLTSMGGSSNGRQPWANFRVAGCPAHDGQAPVELPAASGERDGSLGRCGTVEAIVLLFDPSGLRIILAAGWSRQLPAGPSDRSCHISELAAGR